MDGSWRLLGERWRRWAQRRRVIGDGYLVELNVFFEARSWWLFCLTFHYYAFWIFMKRNCCIGDTGCASGIERLRTIHILQKASMHLSITRLHWICTIMSILLSAFSEGLSDNICTTLLLTPKSYITQSPPALTTSKHIGMLSKHLNHLNPHSLDLTTDQSLPSEALLDKIQNQATRQPNPLITRQHSLA